jgi:hypothetical protein
MYLYILFILCLAFKNQTFLLVHPKWHVLFNGICVFSMFQVHLSS